MDEVWKKIPNMDYSASNHGVIRNDTTGKLFFGYVDVYGYKICCLKFNQKWKTFRLHRLVALAFLGEPNGLFVDHIDNNKTNNSIDNLRYATNRENCIYFTTLKNKMTGTTFHKKNHNKKPWQALIRINNKNKSLGYYETQVEAHNAYIKYITDKFNWKGQTHE